MCQLTYTEGNTVQEQRQTVHSSLPCRVVHACARMRVQVRQRNGGKKQKFCDGSMLLESLSTASEPPWTPLPYIPIAVSCCSGCSGRGCCCSSRLCISVGCISTLQERRELTLQIPVHSCRAKKKKNLKKSHTHHKERKCFKLHQLPCHFYRKHHPLTHVYSFP